jgi:hypothetical protein
MFASLTQSDPIPVPFDPPHTIVVRGLTGRECDAAREAHATGVALGGARHWATKFRRMLEGSISDKAYVEQAIRDPLTGYDRYALVRGGLIAWSYPRPITVRQAAGADLLLLKAEQEARDAAINDLEDEGVDFIATEVLRRTKPALFLTTEEDVAAAQKERPAAAPSA